MVRRLGFVQVDPIAAVERAHQHILFSRNRRYEKEHLRLALEEDRTLFENWTHDAAILPTQVYPHWKHYFERMRNYEIHSGYRRYFAPATPRDIAEVLRCIEKNGALKPRDIEGRKVEWDDAYFAKPSIAKLAMERLWRTGDLAVTRREGNQKVYDLSSRVIPADVFQAEVSREEYVDWACRESLARLGAGTHVQMARFFQAVSRDDAMGWCEGKGAKEVVKVQVDGADGAGSGQSSYALKSTIETMPDLPSAPRGLRLLNPFDPLIHDRQRTQRIFGFDYTVEIWVPEKKRKYGYYVLPILEGERFTGRIDTKVDRKKGVLNVLGLWWEPGVKATNKRMEQLERRLQDLAKFAGVAEVVFTKGYNMR